MKILLTNDDGIRAPGITHLFDALTDPENRFGGPITAPNSVTGFEVFTIAPLSVQSATGHGVTFHLPIMVSDVQVNPRMAGIAVDGRPADCVKLALSNLWEEKFGKGTRPDLLVSGLNSGANCGINVIYSGTVAAAIEGAFLGVPAIAVSLHMGRGNTRWDVAAARARKSIEMVLAKGLPDAHECISINIPITESGGPMPLVKVCPMNTHGLVDSYEKRLSPSKEPYYWATGSGLGFKGCDEGTDVDWLKKGFVTVTPLMYDLTRREHLGRWTDRLGAK
jgi:5'-nucleotidase